MTSSVSVRNLNRLAGALGLLLLIFSCLFGWQAWQSEKNDQIGQTRTALELGQNAIDQYFQQLQASLNWLAMDLVGPDGQLLSEVDPAVRLRQFRSVHPELSAINLVAPDGQMLASSSEGASDRLPNFSAEPSFKRFLQEPNPETRLVLGRPIFGRVSQRWVIPLRYLVRDGQGRACFILAASAPVELLQSFWKEESITSRFSIGLLGDDGYLISRFPLPDGVSLESAYGEPRNGALRSHLLKHGFPAEGYVEGHNKIGSIDAGNLFKRLAHFPITVFVSIPTSEFRRAWLHRVEVPFALLTLLSLGGWMGYRYTLTRQRAWEGERRSAEAALRISESEQRFLLDHMLAGLIVHDATGAVVSMNAQACKLLGLSAEQMSGRAMVDPRWHFIREDGSRLPASDYAVLEVMKTGKPITDLVVGIRQPEAVAPVWLIANIYPAFFSDGVLRQIIVSCVDITARRDVEMALKLSENRYRMLFENSMDAVLQTTPDGEVLAANEAACRMFGMGADEFVRGGRPRIVDPADPRLQRLLDERAASGRATGEMTLRRGDGSPFEAEVSSAVYADHTGSLLASLVVRDVTERRRSEQAMLAKDLAEQSNHAKSEFIARMSHELRTPLNAILGFSEVMLLDEQRPLSTEQRGQLGHVRSAGEHLLLLINDLLDLSRIEAGSLSIRVGNVDTLAIVDEAVRDVAALARTSGVRISVVRPAGALLRARVDPTRLRQVLLNLLSNAIKYNRRGGEVTVRLTAGQDLVRMAVEDNGIGMTQAQQNDLFQPFNRLGRESSATEGTGIGLVITRSLVEMMGGEMAVRSTAGMGSEFSVTLPAEDVAAKGEVVESVDQRRPPHPDGGEMRRVLYVDDDEVNQVLMKAFLAQRPNIALQTVGDGATGIDCARLWRPRLMMIDLMMPGMDGMAVMRAVRADPSLDDTRCVAVSANAMQNEIDLAMAQGFDGYLTKPISLQALFSEIDRWT